MAHPPASQPAQTTAGSLKETIESIIIAFILAFVFRAFVVEAFVIPTGSMAPTLLGKHMVFTCPQCGYVFETGPRDQVEFVRGGIAHREPRLIQGQPNHPTLAVTCPMCQHRVTEPQFRIKPGDRILVLKYLYLVRPPQRWEVVVFRNPKQPAMNYIKRLVGLPHEMLWIAGGNILTRPLDPATGEPIADAPWRLAVKPEHVQREVWQPIYHSRYIPQDAKSRNPPWQSPWQPTTDRIEPIQHGLKFRYAGGATEAGPATLAFDFDRTRYSADDYSPYNAWPRNKQDYVTLDELRLAVTVVPEAGGGAVALELHNDRFAFEARITAAGEPELLVRARGEPAAAGVRGQVLGEARPLAADAIARLELWYADGVASFWRDGQVVARHELPLVVDGRPTVDGPAIRLDADAAAEASRPASFPPQVRVHIDGPPAMLTEVDLDRDLFYRGHGPVGQNARGNLRGSADRKVALHADQFFCLGDNSPRSEDSRMWDRVDPRVQYYTPEHGTGGVGPGIVPRKLLMGRAFFVYLPAPFSLTPTGFPFIPNFADLRFIR